MLRLLRDNIIAIGNIRPPGILQIKPLRMLYICSSLLALPYFHFTYFKGFFFIYNFRGCMIIKTIVFVFIHTTEYEMFLTNDVFSVKNLIHIPTTELYLNVLVIITSTMAIFVHSINLSRVETCFSYLG